MSNQSSSSSRTSGGKGRYRPGGIPRPMECWCGHQVDELTSKTAHNPYRRFFRCSYAAAKKLEGDNHVFRWIDEALIYEIESGEARSKKLEEEFFFIKKTITGRVEVEKKRFEKLEIEVHEKVLERTEIAIADAKRSMWKIMCLVVIFGGVSIIGLTYLFG